jgi:N-acetylmuramoyl-L-alanine amidase
MKRLFAAVGCALLLCAPLPASAAAQPAVTVDGTDVSGQAMATVCSGTTYVSLRALASALDSSSSVWWEDGAARVESESLSLTARPGEDQILVNGKTVSVPLGVQASQGRVLLPVRVLAQAFGAAVYWNPLSGEVALLTDVSRDSSSVNADELYWLARIISAESQGEPLEGQIAVGNVVLNRVQSDQFPDTVYDVIFDSRWGGQFEPVRNGTVYNAPTQESILAAHLCLEGVNVVGDSLYFLDPALAQNLWTTQNCTYVATIGCHEFYL